MTTELLDADVDTSADPATEEAAKEPTEVDIAGRELCLHWATMFDEVYGNERKPEELRAAYAAERIVAESESMSMTRRAMAQLPFEMFVSVLIHYRSEQVARHKVREIVEITGENLSRRHYWDRLSNAAYYAGGLVVIAADLLGGDAS